MATHARVDAHLKADLKLLSGGQPAELSPPHVTRNRRLRRIITPEQGRALPCAHAAQRLRDIADERHDESRMGAPARLHQGLEIRA